MDDLKVFAAYAGATVAATAARVYDVVTQLALRCLHFKMMERQLNGLAFVVNLAQLVAGGAGAAGGYPVSTYVMPVNPSAPPGAPRTVVRNTQTRAVLHGRGGAELAEWIHRNGVLALIFGGDGMHEELIRRSIALIVFLAKQSALSDAQLEQVWSVGTSSRSSAEKVAAVHSILGTASRHLSLRHVLLLLSWVRARELGTLSVRTLQLVGDVARAQLGRDEREAAGADVDDAVRTAAELLLEVVLGTPTGR